MDLGARSSDIIEMTDCDYDDLGELFPRLSKEVRENWKNGQKKTLVFLYFAGRATYDGYINVSLNDYERSSFPLE